MRPITARVAARLREERQRQGVSLESLASAARVSPNAIIRFETGKTSIQLDTLTRLVVRGLGLDWASFMASTGPAVATAARSESRPLSESSGSRSTAKVVGSGRAHSAASPAPRRQGDRSQQRLRSER
jgi:XRE family transcriptional regulator, regulator of sulfur utilization